MTRRSLLNLALVGTASSTACTPNKTQILSMLDHIERTGNLTIIDFVALGAGGFIGSSVGKLVLPGDQWRMSLAPAGDWIAWLPRPEYPITPEQSKVYFASNPNSVRTIEIKGLVGELIAIASGGMRLVVFAGGIAKPDRRLIVLNLPRGEVEDDLTDLVGRLSADRIVCLRLAGAADRLVVEFMQAFTVLDLTSHRVVMEGKGHSPSLSPSGETVAYVDESGKFNLTTIATGKTKRLFRFSKTHGIGSWTPGGELVLAGIECPVCFFWYLAAVDCVAETYAEIVRLEEHDSGDKCGLISQRLLTA